MRIYTLKIKTGFSNESDIGGVLSSHRSTPSAEKTEYFRTTEARIHRRNQIQMAVDIIGLCAWLVSLEDGELEIKD